MNYPLHSHNESRDIEKLIEIKISEAPCRNHISNRRLSGSKEKNNINLTHRILEEEKRSGAKGSQRPSGELREKNSDSLCL